MVVVVVLLVVVVVVVVVVDGVVDVVPEPPGWHCEDARPPPGDGPTAAGSESPTLKRLLCGTERAIWDPSCGDPVLGSNGI